VERERFWSKFSPIKRTLKRATRVLRGSCPSTLRVLGTTTHKKNLNSTFTTSFCDCVADPFLIVPSCSVLPLSRVHAHLDFSREHYVCHYRSCQLSSSVALSDARRTIAICIMYRIESNDFSKTLTIYSGVHRCVQVRSWSDTDCSMFWNRLKTLELIRTLSTLWDSRPIVVERWASCTIAVFSNLKER